VKVIVNGDERSLPEGSVVLDVVQRFGPPRHDRGVAVALNGEVVGRGAWDEQPVNDGDAVEVLVAIGGG
jgi:sulfur carrier protein